MDELFKMLVVALLSSFVEGTGSVKANVSALLTAVVKTV